MALIGRLRSLLHSLGIEVTKHPAPGTYVRLLRDIAEARQVEAVIDVGGHWGEFARTMRKVVKFAGPIESFEPSADSYETLCATMKNDPAWQGHRLAIGAEAGRLELNIFDSTVLNSLRPSSGLLDLGAASTETVEVRRLDEVVTIPGQLLLKTDTQGYDLEVLRGATGLLGRTTAIAIELAQRNLYEGAPGLVDMIESLDSYGFELAGLSPLLRDPNEKTRVIEFDSVFVRR